MNVTLYSAASAYASIVASDGNTYTANASGAITVPESLRNEFVRLGFSPNAGSGGATAWGDITGDMSSQTDLNAALGAKVDGNGITDIEVVESIPENPDANTIYFPTGE